MKATIPLGQGAIEIDGTPAEIAEVIRQAVGGPARRGPGRPLRVRTEPAKPVPPAITKWRKLQGKYLGGMKALSRAEKKRVQEVRAKGDLAAALKEIERIRAKKKP